MKFAYIDESGTGDEPYAVMAGVIIDAQRMRPTKEEWSDLLAALSEIVEKEVKEFIPEISTLGTSLGEAYRALNEQKL